MIEQLLPCPFCGSDSIDYDNCDYGNGKWLTCNGCGLRVTAEYGEDLESKWNQRKPYEKVKDYADSNRVDIIAKKENANLGMYIHKWLVDNKKTVNDVELLRRSTFDKDGIVVIYHLRDKTLPEYQDLKSEIKALNERVVELESVVLELEKKLKEAEECNDALRGY